MSKDIKFSFQGKADIHSLYEIIERLRGDDGCPWDKKQTPQTLKKYLLEETYEVIDAINKENPHEIKEELGDLLFTLLFMIYLFVEKQVFSFYDLIFFTFQKMVRRHPHVFGEEKAKDAEEVLNQWYKIKEEEGKGNSLLGNIPRSLPSLHRAYRLGEKASRVGFDWYTPEEVLPKIYEELKEIEEALKSNDKASLKIEVGDLLFTIANLARKLEINPEEALRAALDKFEERFKRLEGEIKSRGKSFQELTLNEMDKIWEEIKAK